MEWVKLGDVVEVQKGKKVSESEHNTGLRYIQIEDLRNDNNIKFTDQENSVKVNADDVLLAWDGANAGISSYGLEGIIGSTLARIRVKEKYSNIIKSEYLGLFLQFNENYLRNTANGATIPHVNRGALLNLKLNAVDLEYQQKVIALMSNISNIISTRKAQIAALDELVQSVFYDMFENKSFELVKLGEKVKVNPPKSEVKNLDENLKVTFLPMENVSENGEVDLSETRKISEVYSGFTYAKNGDVVVAKITPSFENGKGAYLNNLCNGIAFGTTEFHVLRPKKACEINYIWLYYLTMTKKFRMYGELNMSGSAGQKRVSKIFIENYEIPLPPLELQEQFAAKVEAIEVQKAKLQTSLEEMETLFDALMQEAFSGNLG